MIERGRDGCYHPGSVEEVRELILEASTRGVNLRVRGSGHSVPASIRSDRPSAGGPDAAGMDVMLDRMRAVVITPEHDGAHAIVQVGAGCNIGLDPHDPSGTSTWENSLNVQLHRAGWALCAMGGISHQTVAGFLTTGSAGGSTQHSLADTVVGLEFVDGHGEIHHVCSSDTGEKLRLFHAAGVSMGLLGVVTTVWLRVVPTYTLVGREVTTPLADCSIDVFGERRDRRPGLVEFVRNAPFSRILWWPQPAFDRIQVWSAEPEARRSDFQPTPFEILSQRQTLSASLLQTVVGNLPDLSQVPRQLENLCWFSHLERALAGLQTIDELRPAVRRTSRPGPSAFARDARFGGLSKGRINRWRQAAARSLCQLAEKISQRMFENGVVHKVGIGIDRRMPHRIHRLMKIYVPDGTKEFRDHWHGILPMDDQLDDRLWPTSFAELWFPMEAASAVLRRLRDIHREKSASERYQLSRAFPVEIYASPRSPFWLSPGYERESLRINLIWLDQWPGDPVGNLYQSYYEALKEFGFRPHWGKYLPAPSDDWRAYYRRHCPQLQDFLDIRRRLDPRHLFVNEYWRNHLGVTF
jgi:D-arabinono-1,4-lactone oxidase